MTLRDPEPGEYRSFKLVDRKAIPKRWKADAYQRTNGRCYVCQKAVPLAGPDVQYDHRTPLWLDEGAHKVENIFPICTTPCHRDKSANEAPIRAKVLRLIKAKAGVKKDKRPIPSRGFDRSMTKGFDGKVRPRSVRAKKPEDRPSDWVRDEPSNDVKAPITRRSAGGGGR